MRLADDFLYCYYRLEISLCCQNSDDEIRNMFFTGGK